MSQETVSACFRICLVTVTVASWAFATWILSHRCSVPQFFGRYSSDYLLIVLGSVLGALALSTIHLGLVYRRVYRTCCRLRGQLILAAVAT